MDWITSNWYIVLGILVVFVGGFYVPVLRQFIFVGFRSLLSEAVIKKMVLIFAEKLVKSTKNKLDDVWFSTLKSKIDKS